MRPQVFYSLLFLLVGACTGGMLLYNLSIQEQYATTIEYRYPAVSQAQADSGVQSLPEPATEEEGALDSVTFPLELNAATEQELMFIPRVGEVTAARIVQYREVLGGYTDLAQLMEIKGIGEETYRHLYTYLYIEGAD